MLKERVIEVLREHPGLTGKQIAKELGNIDKSELNSYLYKNSEGLVQKDWKWYLSDGGNVLELSGQRWIDAVHFEDELSKAGGVLESEDTQWVIQFPERCKILLIAGARIIMLSNQCVQIGKNIELDFSKCPNTKHYLDRLGFFDHLSQKVKVTPKPPKASKAKRFQGNSENMFEMESICLDNFDYTLPEKLTKIFVNHAGQEYYHAVFTIFAELIGNVQEHSDTPIPGIVALQLYSGRQKHIQTVISDSGLGISTTLKKNLQKYYPSLSDSLDLDSEDTDVFLVSAALTKGGLSQFGSNPDGAARGLGLWKTQNYAAKYNAEVVVRQPSFELKLVYEDGVLTGVQTKPGLSLIQGTQICFDFFLS